VGETWVKLESSPPVRVTSASAKLLLAAERLKVMTAVQARLHYTFKQELRLLAEIIRDYTSPDYDYEPDDNATRQAKQEEELDYEKWRTEQCKNIITDNRKLRDARYEKRREIDVQTAAWREEEKLKEMK
jgi:hypothetical protein